VVPPGPRFQEGTSCTHAPVVAPFVLAGICRFVGGIGHLVQKLYCAKSDAEEKSHQCLSDRMQEDLLKRLDLQAPYMFTVE
jgi:hypothetical protein